MTNGNGNLRIVSTLDPDSIVHIIVDEAGVTLLAVDRNTDQRVHVTMGGEQLDQLVAEVQRIRREQGLSDPATVDTAGE